MTRVKICGISSNEAAGLRSTRAQIFWVRVLSAKPSVHPTRSAEIIIEHLRGYRPVGWQAVGVVVNIPLDTVNDLAERCALDVIQVCGDEDDAYCRALIRPGNQGASA